MAESGSDSFRSTLAGGSDNFRSTLEGGHDYIFDFYCDLCERDGLQNEAVGFCVDCQDYLCTECFRNHLKPGPCRNHVLLDQHQMPKDQQQNREAGKTRVQHVTYIQVRSRGDNIKPYISGSVILPGKKLVVVDNENGNVRLIDLTYNQVVSQLKLAGTLWDITQVDSTKVAVTSCDTSTIYVVNVGANLLKLDRKMKVKGQCSGIASINDQLVVSYVEPVKVEIIDSTTGQVIQTVVKEDKGRELFTHPLYVAVSKDGQSIYISDFHSNTVTSVDLHGKVRATYKDGRLNAPHGLTVDSAGRVYVCGLRSNNILQLTADLTDIQELSDGAVSQPVSAYYSDATGRFYFGMAMALISIYQLK